MNKPQTTQSLITEYHALQGLLETWEKQPSNVQYRNHAYILKLRSKIRNVRNYLQHRKGPDSDIL